MPRRRTQAPKRRDSVVPEWSSTWVQASVGIRARKSSSTAPNAARPARSRRPRAAGTGWLAGPGPRSRQVPAPGRPCRAPRIPPGPAGRSGAGSRGLVRTSRGGHLPAGRTGARRLRVVIKVMAGRAPPAAVRTVGAAGEARGGCDCPAGQHAGSLAPSIRAALAARSGAEDHGRVVMWDQGASREADRWSWRARLARSTSASPARRRSGCGRSSSSVADAAIPVTMG